MRSSDLPVIFNGAVVTLVLFFLSIAIGFLASLGLAIVGLRQSRLCRWSYAAFIVVFRGCPILVLLYIIYYGLATVPLIRDTAWLWYLFSSASFCALLGLSLNHAGYVSELLRVGIASVPRPTVEAYRSLGLSELHGFLLIRLPLGLRNAFGGYRNELVLFIKSTAAVSAITVTDLLTAANQIVSLTFDTVTPYLVVGAIYWCLVAILNRGLDGVWMVLAPDHRPAAARAASERLYGARSACE